MACVTDRDILPDCAREALGLKDGSVEEGKSHLQPRFEGDLRDEAARAKWINGRRRDDGDNVRTFVADHWTLEYDLAHAGLGRSLHTAIALAKDEARLDTTGGSSTGEERRGVITKAEGSWEQLNQEFGDRQDSREYLACRVYEPLHRGLSKPTTAQHLASLLAEHAGAIEISTDGGNWKQLVPHYIRDAIEYVTGSAGVQSTAGEKTSKDGSVSR